MNRATVAYEVVEATRPHFFNVFFLYNHLQHRKLLEKNYISHGSALKSPPIRVKYVKSCQKNTLASAHTHKTLWISLWSQYVYCNRHKLQGFILYNCYLQINVFNLFKKSYFATFFIMKSAIQINLNRIEFRILLFLIRISLYYRGIIVFNLNKPSFCPIFFYIHLCFKSKFVMLWLTL